MKTTEYAGIDYGRGQANTDPASGIRYGVISQHSINPDAFDDVWQNARDLSHENAVSEFKRTIGQCADAAELHALCKETVGMSRDSVEAWVNELPVDYAFPLSPEHVENVWDVWEDSFNDRYEDNGERNWLYEAGGYKLTNCLQTDVFILASPYYTHAQFCSPCVPGAGNIDSPCADGPKTFCLGHDYFEDNKAPYPVYSVETGELVNAA